jgi:diguanylate cyclase (GGDEF)-like protein
MLSDRLAQSINHAKRDNKKVAVLFLDLDKFKTVNDTLGHDVGDLLLVKIAKRLKNSIRKSDTASRLGGDEFIVLLDGFKNIHDILEVISKIQTNLKKDININGTTFNIEVSIGISVYPNDGQTPEILLKNADIAMYNAKEDGRDLYRFFTEQINENVQKQAEIEKSLHIAIQRKEFVLHYQPLVSTKTGIIQGVEALIRWQHPTKGLIFPNDFIPIAEDSKLIVEIGKWVIWESMTQMSSWKKKGYGIKKISINIAGRQLEDDNFLDYMKNTLLSTQCKAEWIEIEVIERYFMKNIEKSIEVLNKIRQMNIDIAMDDFGTGYSSLAYLRRLPLTKLKIDRMFITNILSSYEDKAITETIIALGSGLKMVVLAEGVETKEEKEFLEHFGCDQIQGYFFSKPLPLKEIEKLLEKGHCEVNVV